ncbi:MULTISPECIES: HD domain-containing protein [unclassified Thioalkalivibrio]|uniref:HD domain-containing protein n=1 Tax=unclassified Thioalkalivibrio TaxID=2621013 RepID=UPI00036B010D|nr:MULTISPECIES: HD domain-containing protein [unclassified Thioalkalivibrio]
MSTVLTRRYESALVYATQLHATQKRKGTEVPYISHLLAVSGLVLEGGGDEDEAIAGLLHDGPEDQGGEATLNQIRQLFGSRVGDIVAACSDTFETEKPAWRKRKEDYLKHLEDADDSVLLVSCADKLHNARSILDDFHQVGDRLWDRFNASRDETLWYYGALSRVFAARGPHDLAERLERILQELSAACVADNNPAGDSTEEKHV